MTNDLRERLKRLAVIRSLSSEKWDEAETLAHALEDIVQSLRKLEPLYRSLSDAVISDDEASDVLHDFAEELAHVAYHLNDSKYLRIFADRHSTSPATSSD
jgi:hypothetical protein